MLAKRKKYTTKNVSPLLEEWEEDGEWQEISVLSNDNDKTESIRKS